MKQFLFICSLFFLIILSPVLLRAQSDTVSTSGVTIVSSFRPTLKQTPKISFSATALTADTTRSVLPYLVSHRPVTFDNTVRSVQPLAYAIDTAKPFSNRSFIKLGYGNLRNPYVRGGISMGNGVSNGLSVTGRYFSLTQRPDQRDMRFYSLAELKAEGYSQFKGVPLQLSSAVGFKNEIVNNNFLYDSNRVLNTFPQDTIRQQFSLLSAQVHLRSTAPMASGISISPVVRFYRFFDRRNNNETTVQVQAPLQKQIGESWMLQTTFFLSAIRYAQSKSLSPVGAIDTLHVNTLFSVNPSLRYHQNSFQLQAGVSPTWNEDRFAVLPQLALSYRLPSQKATLLVGWNGRWTQNTYRELAALNPWIWAPSVLQTTRLTERYIGIRGQLNARLQYELRASYNTITDQPLWLNDTSRVPSSGFVVVYDRLNQLQLDAQVNYQIAEHFRFSSRILINQFFALSSQQEPWGLLPLEWETSLRVALTDELFLQSELVLFRGGQSVDTYKNNSKVKGAADLNASLTFRLSRSVQLWAQFNNLFNQSYQRWSRNPVFGFNCSGGIVFSFNEKKNP